MSQAHLVVIGTGITALTIARTLLLAHPPLPLKITLLDKAGAPGGRVSSRIYDNGTILEPGLRVFESPKGSDGTEGLFGKEVERWREEGWIREVGIEKRKGIMGDGRWWEGVGGIKSLANGLVEEVKKAGGDRLAIHYNIQASNPTPVSLTGPILLNTITPIELAPISLLINTAPTPQITQLLPPSIPAPPVLYIQTIAFLLPTLHLPSLPIYHRHPHPLITSISTGYDREGNTTGLVFQATPQKLGVEFSKDESDDETVRKAFWKIIKEAKLLPESHIDESLGGRQAQIKRWKFAQVAKAGEPGVGEVRKESEDEIIICEGGRVIFAGDGTSGGNGGVEGAWRSAVRAAEEVRKILEKESKL